MALGVVCLVSSLVSPGWSGRSDHSPSPSLPFSLTMTRRPLSHSHSYSTPTYSLLPPTSLPLSYSSLTKTPSLTKVLSLPSTATVSLPPIQIPLPHRLRATAAAHPTALGHWVVYATSTPNCLDSLSVSARSSLVASSASPLLLILSCCYLEPAADLSARNSLHHQFHLPLPPFKSPSGTSSSFISSILLLNFAIAKS